MCINMGDLLLLTVTVMVLSSGNGIEESLLIPNINGLLSNNVTFLIKGVVTYMLVLIGMSNFGSFI